MPIAVGIPEPALASETALANIIWIDKIRQELRDQPRWQPDNIQTDGVMGGLSATSSPWLVSRKPIWDTSAMFVRYVPNVPGPSISYTVVDSLAALSASTDVYVNRDTGELIFQTIPLGSGTLAVNYQWVRWSDDQILTALMEGFKDLSLRGFFRDQVDVAFQLQINQFEYELPAWAMDPRARISAVEIKVIDIVTEDWHPYHGWERLGYDRIRIPDANRWAPLGKIRVRGQGPYTQLGDMEPAVFSLVKWYAKGKLLLDQDAVRSREDTMIPAKDEGAQQAGVMANLGSRYMTIYQNAVQKQKRPAKRGLRIRTYR